MDTSGLNVSFDTLCAFHPAFALAILNGVAVRPNLRTIQVVFSSTATGQVLPASFDQQITAYSVFSGCDVSLDPTSAFAGNPLKSMSDTFQAMTSGITMQMLVRSKNEGDYSPIPTDTPLQMVPSILRKAAGIWFMESPDNVKAQFTLASVPPGGAQAVPITVWVTLAFLVLGYNSENYLRLRPLDARAQLNAALAALRQGYAPAAP